MNNQETHNDDKQIIKGNIETKAMSNTNLTKITGVNTGVREEEHKPHPNNWGKHGCSRRGTQASPK